MSEPRWLDAEAAAAYISVRVDELPRLRRAGKLPSPSWHLGPRKPRYDRLQLDAMFGGGTASTDADSAVQALAHEIAAEGRPRRPQAPR
jgi:hypothetical protein